MVSVTTYRDAGFLSEAFINFLCLLGWSPKNDREQMSLAELVDLFTLEGINRANAVVNFKEAATTPEETFDPKAVWLNAEHLRALSVDDLSSRLLPIVHAAGHAVDPAKMLQITPLIRERIRLLNDVLTAADFFFVDELPPYDPAELIPQKGDAALARRVLEKRARFATIPSSGMIRDQALAERRKSLASRPARFSPSVSRSAVAKMPLRYSKPSKCSGRKKP